MLALVVKHTWVLGFQLMTHLVDRMTRDYTYSPVGYPPVDQLIGPSRNYSSVFVAISRGPRKIES